MISIAIAEDNKLLARSLQEKLLAATTDIVVKFIASNGNELLKYLEKDSTVDVVLMDIEMPQMDGIIATEQVCSRYPHIKVIILTVFDDDEKIFSAIQAGAMGYLLKDESAEEIIKGIRMILEGGAPMSATIAAKTLQLLRNPQPLPRQMCDEGVTLSNREIEILELLEKGYDYKKIADQLFISPSTVRKHLENIYHKLQVHNKMQAVRKAIQYKII
ncbi:MAG: response regulator transcription factor [Bacteroidetes bacterium]|nr:response regulator transcription factor [Bacteroidota bacterium]